MRQEQTSKTRHTVYFRSSASVHARLSQASTTTAADMSKIFSGAHGWPRTWEASLVTGVDYSIATVACGMKGKGGEISSIHIAYLQRMKSMVDCSGVDSAWFFS